MNLLRFSLNLLCRDWRVLLVLAVGSLATVGLFADRVRQALQQEAQSLIGADMRISSMRYAACACGESLALGRSWFG